MVAPTSAHRSRIGPIASGGWAAQITVAPVWMMPDLAVAMSSMRVAQPLGVVQTDRGDHTGVGLQHVGRVLGAAEPDLDDRHVDRRVGERGQRHRRGQVEIGQRLLAPRSSRKLARPARPPVDLDERLLVDRRAVDADPFAHRLQVRAGVAPGAQPVRPQQRVDHPGRRGLAVRAGQVDRPGTPAADCPAGRAGPRSGRGRRPSGCSHGGSARPRPWRTPRS